MNRKISLGAAISLMALTAAAAVTLTAVFMMHSLNSSILNFANRSAMFKKLSSVDSIVRSKYVGAIDESELEDDTIKGYVSGLSDKYGTYLDAGEYKSIALSNDGQNIGIGVNIVKTEDGQIKVVSVTDNSPAESAGIKVNDIISSIDGGSVKSIGAAAAINRLKGTEGSAVSVNILRDGKKLSFSITRKKYSVDSVSSKFIGNLGYIKITEFNSKTPSQFSAQLDKLISGGAKGLIFDVRNNPGGLIKSVVPIIDKLVPKGPIVSAKYKDGKKKVLFTSDSNEVNLPMAVLTNQNTASAAELFTAALKDYNKAKSVGTRTYGKGTMQEICDLYDGTALDLSVAYFYPPKSGNFEGKGVAPDITVTLSKEKQRNFYSLSEDDDDQLQSAISYVELKIK